MITSCPKLHFKTPLKLDFNYTFEFHSSIGWNQGEKLDFKTPLQNFTLIETRAAILGDEIFRTIEPSTATLLYTFSKTDQHLVLKNLIPIRFKGSVHEKWKGYRLNAIKKRFWSPLILLLSVASVRRKLLKRTYTEERNVHTNWESCNTWLGS